MNSREIDEISSPMNAGMMMKKKKVQKVHEADKKEHTGLKITTMGLSLKSTVTNCDEVMSPLMLRF